MSSAEISMVSFYDQHQESLARLFELVGVKAEAADSLEDAVAATQPWVRGDHIKPEQRFEIDESDEGELTELYDEFGLVRGYDLLPRRYDQILMLGGTYWGTNHRLKFLREAMEHGGITTDKIMLLGGEREIFSEEIPAICDDLENMDPGAAREDIYWETDILHLAAIKQLEDVVALNPIEISDETGHQRPHLQEFSWNGVPLTLMHTLAVERNGQPRHTTEACMVDWLQTASPKPDAVVGFIAANPHTIRVGRSAYAMLSEHGREDIALLPAGPSVLQRVGHHTYLGEIARHLYEDSRLAAAEFGLADSLGVAGK